MCWRNYWPISCAGGTPPTSDDCVSFQELIFSCLVLSHLRGFYRLMKRQALWFGVIFGGGGGLFGTFPKGSLTKELGTCNVSFVLQALFASTLERLCPWPQHLNWPKSPIQQRNKMRLSLLRLRRGSTASPSPLRHLFLQLNPLALTF